MAILQVRNMDEGLYASLERRAAMEHRSISQEVITIIQRHLSAPGPFECADDAALKLAGTWRDRRSEKEIVADIRKQRRKTRRVKEVL